MDKRALIKKYHTICSKAGIDAESKCAMLDGYNVSSSKELTEQQLIEVIAFIEKGQTKEADKWRKRVIAAIGGWMRENGVPERMELIKAIACRAASTEHFNDINVSKLKRVYAEFVRKNQVHQNSVRVKQDVMAYLSLRN